MPKTILICALISWLVLSGCNAPGTPTPTPTSSALLGDSFFFGQAFVDTNANGRIDADDAPVPNATFIVRLPGGAEFGDLTNAEGRATVTVPGGSDYPVTLRMQPPAGITLTLISPAEVVLPEASGDNAQFLFAPGPATPTP